MVTATAEQLRSLGFEELADDNKTYGISWFDKEGILAIARLVKETIYNVTRAKDSKNNFYNAEEINEKFADVTSLLTDLKNPRWIGIESQIREDLYKIAQTPPSEDAEPIISRAINRIRKINNYDIRNRASIEINGAITAWQLGKPENYLSQYKTNTY